jgi:RimJ/RimL family protein N-acetyltransferase
MSQPYQFAPFREEHVALMRDWPGRPHVAEWWDGVPSLDEIRGEYCRPTDIDPYIVYLDDRPIGFIQSYRAMGSADGWWRDIDDPGIVGIDQFIGEQDLLGQGHGTAMIRAFVDRLLADPSVTKVQVDPHPANARAIRCYEKVGFVPRRVIDTPDGPALYMLLDP